MYPFALMHIFHWRKPKKCEISTVGKSIHILERFAIPQINIGKLGAIGQAIEVLERTTVTQKQSGKLGTVG